MTDVPTQCPQCRSRNLTVTRRWSVFLDVQVEFGDVSHSLPITAIVSQSGEVTADGSIDWSEEIIPVESTVSEIEVESPGTDVAVEFEPSRADLPTWYVDSWGLVYACERCGWSGDAPASLPSGTRRATGARPRPSGAAAPRSSTAPRNTDEVTGDEAEGR